MKRVLIALSVIFYISFVLATTTTLSVSQASFNVNPGDSGSVIISYSINNSGGNAGQKGISLTGTPRFISYLGGPVSFEANITTNGSVTINYLIPLNATAGMFVNSVVIDEKVLDLTFNIQQPPQNTSGILVFPTNKIVTVKQGEEKTQNIIITVPSNYPRTIIIQSVDFNPNIDTIKFGDLSIGQVSPGQTVQIPIIFSGIGASTGTYQTQLSIFAVDTQGQVSLPSVNLQLQVSSGISPTINFSLNELPSCSLNAIELNLNNTYSLTCSRPNPNIEIKPLIDNFYLKGISVDQTSSQFIYNFQAKKIGNTKFIAEFIYQNSPIGDPFQQEVKISPSGNSPIPGTILALLFYQSGQQISKPSLEPKETIIQIVDNQTNSLVQNAGLQLGGVNINNTLTLEAGKNYEIRAFAPGYLDLVSSFNVSRTPIIITIIPQKSYVVGDSLNITTNPDNATLFLNGVAITSPYILTTSGNHILKAEKGGYLTTERNLSVASVIQVLTLTPIYDDWKKGKDVSIKLSQSDIWYVSFEKEIEQSYNPPINISTGVGDTITFKIEDMGRYNIYSGGLLVTSQTIKKSSFFNSTFFWVMLGIVVLVLLFFIIKGMGGGEESGEETLGY